MSSSAGTASKKRKRDESSNESISFEVGSSSSPGSIGPLLGNFPAIQAPNDTPFKVYSRKKSKKDKDDDGGKNDRTLVVGETPAVEFISNEEDSRRAASSGCHYLLAVRDRRTNKVRIIPEAKTPFILTRTVKALKSISPDDAPSTLAYQEARTALGETFGTKKSQAAIRARERNRVDVGAMQGVMSHVVEGIDKAAEGLLTKEEAKDLADSARLIPPFSATATEPSDIYPLNDMIPDTEVKAINVAPLEQNLSNKDYVGMLPWRNSKWVTGHLRRIGAEKEKSKARKRNLKLILYVSTMFLFRRIISHPKGLEKDAVYEKMNSVPTILVDGLLSRFTESTRSSSVHMFTSAMSTKFLAYLLALCLRVDDFASNPKTLSDDLSLSVTGVNAAYKSLGCKLKALTERERTNRGLSDSLADTKFAVLTAPVQFPKVRTGKKRK